MCDFCEIAADGTAVSSDKFGCTGFMDCRGAEKLTVTLPQTTAEKPSHGLAFYNAEKRLLLFIPSPTGAETATVEREITVPENAAYFKATYFNYSERKSHNYGEFRCEVEYPEGFALPPKRNYQDGVIYFSQEINQSLDVSDTSDMKQTTAALMLPKTYTPDGTPTKMILYFHGYSHTIYYGHLGQTANFAKQKENFTERGYAVLCFNGARDNGKKGEFPGGGLPQFDRAAQQCIEYVLNHYNVDSGIYVVGGSAGGLGALTYVSNYGSVEQTKNRSFVKALMLLSGWTDIRANPWACGVRKYYAEYLGVSPDGEYPAELDAINPNAMTAEQLAGTNLGKIPTYAFMGAGEITETAHIWYALHDYMKKVSTLRNYRGFRIFDEYDHSQIVSGGVPAVDNAVCDFFDDPSGSFLSNATFEK
ncbi:MAG: hypothetical protein MJ082_05785 [Clostridia bacterium]|nr:hypothetical protein [Clostridia bacterium]